MSARYFILAVHGSGEPKLYLRQRRDDAVERFAAIVARKPIWALLLEYDSANVVRIITSEGKIQ